MTTMDTTDTEALDQQIEAFGEQFMTAGLGTAETTVAWLGRSLGLYDALRGEDGLTPAHLADRTGTDARYIREWLEHQAVAQVLTVDDPAQSADERRYRLPEAHAIALLDKEHPGYVGVFAELTPMLARVLDMVQDAFRTGAGVPFASYGLHDLQAEMSRPMFANSLVQEWLPALPDLHARLEAGEELRVVDVGCGEGWAGIYLAEAYPAVTVDGFDLDDASIAVARTNASERGLSDRVRFEVRDIHSIDADARYDLAFACEVIHDLPDPVDVLAVIRRITDGGGAVLVVDEGVAERFEPSGDIVERFMYTMSIVHCLPVGRDAETSVATGTVMRPDTFARYATGAGFAGVDILPIENPFYRFYRPHV